MRSGRVAALDDYILALVGVRERGAKRFSRFASPRAVALEALALGSLPGLRPRERAMVLGAPLLAGLIGRAVKRLFPRERPSKSRFGPQGGESFPSTHAAHSTALLLAAAELARRHGAGWVYGPAVACALTVALERIRAGAHWPTDAIGGLALGAGAAACTMAATGAG